MITLRCVFLWYRHFEFAFEIAKMARKERLPGIHCKFGNGLEDEVSLGANFH